ncbi:MAG TPA: PIN domain-containing protein [Thermoanaerobaculia bacterium]|nr:PIN domain-containing protein [Thermoanaerobaculia bacterium]
MNKLVADTNAVIEFTRGGNAPQQLRGNDEVILPLPVVGELYSGAHMSQRVQHNLSVVEDLLLVWQVLLPDMETARVYGRLRAALRQPAIRHSTLNDLWIAALCLQHALPLLTNDRGFDAIDGLTVLHW